MGHDTNKKLSEKHDAASNPAAAEAIKKAAKQKKLNCADAHRIAKNLGLKPAQMGVQIDLLDHAITLCQLGLFGYEDGGKGFDPDIALSPDLETRIDTAAQNGRISCRDCWDIAVEFKMKRLDVGSACEKMQLKIKPCQLGFF